MGGSIPTYGFHLCAAFTAAAGRYWLWVFPRVARELRRRRELALEIPDPFLRRVALQSLQCKRYNLEGAASIELLAGKASSLNLVRALTACQAMCDYLDLLAEQPCADPVANGYRLHEALIVALSEDAPARDYYAYSSHGRDGGYLATLVRDVRTALRSLPGRSHVVGPLAQVAERITVYQSLNHGDAAGSYEPFREWAATHTATAGSLEWWEMGAAAGSTMAIFALLACASDPALTAEHAHAIQCAYFPWIGALHTLLDSLVDFDEDRLAEEHCLVGHYDSPEQAASRLSTIAEQAVARAHALPGGARHMLILLAMASFYLCEVRNIRSAHACAVVPALRSALGGLTAPAMAMIDTRRRISRSVRDKLPDALPSCTPCPPACQAPP